MIDAQTLVGVDVNAMAVSRSMGRIEAQAVPHVSTPADVDAHVVLAAAAVHTLAETMKTVLTALGTR